MTALERTLKRARNQVSGDTLVVVEGVYSMDGDIAPLRDVYDLTARYNVKLMVDDAHATGMLGATGRGSGEHFDLHGKPDVVMGTFSKSLGGLGGFVAGRGDVIRYLRYFSRPYFFAASMPPAQVAAHLEAINVMLDEPDRHRRLWDNVRYFHGELTKRGYDIGNTQTAVTPIIIGDTNKLMAVTRFMHEKGIFVNAVPYPAVPRKQDRLRLSISALHTKADIDTTLDAMDEANAEYEFARATS